MEFCILGPLEVRADGDRLALGGPRQRALLAILLLNADRVVSREHLIEELWADEAPAEAQHALDVQVSRLRKTLRSARDTESVIVTRAPGYLLHVAPEELDLRRFERLFAEGRAALEDGDAAAAVDALRAAEGLWRGRPLADLEFEQFARLDIERLEELRLGAVEERIEAELALGRHRGAVAELEALVTEHPLRERLRGQLMLALYRSGRQAEALEVFRSARTLLVDELGLDPGPQLRALEQAILRQDEALGPAAAGLVAVTAPAQRSPVPRPPPQVADARRPSIGRRVVPRWLLAAPLAAAAATVAIVVLAGDGTRASPRGDALALVSLRDGTIGGAATLGAPPTRAAAGFGSLWVTHYGAGTVARVDPGDRVVRQTIGVGSGPSGLAAGAGAVWVANSLDGTVSRIDPATQQVVQTIAVGTRPSDIAVADGVVWVASAAADALTGLDPRSGTAVRIIDLGSSPTALAAGAGALWVASESGRAVLRIEPRRGAVSATIAVGGGPSAIAVGAGAVWVANSLDGTVSRIDPARNSVAATIPVGDGPVAVAVSDGAVWVANEFAGTLSRIDAVSDRVTVSTKAGDEPVTLAVQAGRLWVGERGQGPSHRGGRLVLLNQNRSFSSIDPAAAEELFPPTLIGMTNDGLVTFKHVDGSDGNELVPDLAVSLPAPTDGGRIYTFKLRPGIRYSNGQPLRAGDFRYALERVFKQRSAGAAFYDSLLGARRCARMPQRCDLSRGISYDDRESTVSIRLRAPDPELLYKLALPFAYAVPGGAPPADVGTRPLPATGPYMIADYHPGRELRLVRNPQFGEWSRAAQPDGYPSEIIWKLGVSADASVDAIEHGRADWMLGFDALPANRRREIATRYASQLHVHSTLATDYLVLNVRDPPFNDVRARRAINYAIDRRAAVRLYGGATEAAPTCQILPPQMPGYRRHCPYTAHASPSGRWTAPDLKMARRLVAASGTTGMRIVVLDSPTPEIYRDEGRLTVDALRRIGYRARLRLVPDDVFTRVAGNAGEDRSNVQSGGWGADFPAASDFIELKLSCSSLHPGGDPSSGSTGYCDPTLDRMMQRARRLQITAPQTANNLWARIDHAFVDRAAWLPLVTPTSTDLVSKRAGNYRYHPLWGPLLDQLWLR